MIFLCENGHGAAAQSNCNCGRCCLGREMVIQRHRAEEAEAEAARIAEVQVAQVAEFWRTNARYTRMEAALRETVEHLATAHTCVECPVLDRARSVLNGEEEP